MHTFINIIKYLSPFRNNIYNSHFTYSVKRKQLQRIPLLLIQLKNYSFLKDQNDIKICTCGELSSSDAGRKVVIRGFLQYQRKGMFCVLRDAFGSTQIIIDNDKMTEALTDTPFESYIEVIGEVKRRPEDQLNMSMKTGEIEVLAEEFIVVNKAKDNIPFLIRNHNMPTEIVAMKHRYLDLRHPHLQSNLRFRSKIGKKIRDYLQDIEEFVEITTPTLSVHTPGGAHEFVVPSQLEGKFYNLAQSPQLYKQLAVIGGFEKYFQFAVCYRDEGGKPDRQPEFMQLDLEMSNATFSKIQNLMETLISYSWPKEFLPPKIPFPTITYSEAMENYGTDKPDTRFGSKISDVTKIVSQSDSSLINSFLKDSSSVAKSFVIKGGKEFIKKSHHKEWEKIAKEEAGLNGVILLHVEENNSLKGKMAKVFPEHIKQQLIEHLKAVEKDSIVLSIGHKSKVLKLLGKLRLLMAEICPSTQAVLQDRSVFNFLWVTDFPLFERDDVTQELLPCHHPFTAPKPSHKHLLDTNPLEVHSQHYDLVLNGCEVAGGSIRNHDAKLQKDIFEILNIDSSKFTFLLEALSCGAPPHGGIALGFDRYISMLLGCKSIREVMAFPKTAEGKCLMLGAPENITESQKKRFHIEICNVENVSSE